MSEKKHNFPVRQFAIMGNVCVGKTRLFDELYKAGLTQIHDTPGAATLSANSEDEMVARDLILSGQVEGVIFVADAKNLRRSLAFALEVAELGLPMVLDINMLDEAESMGIEVNHAVLARELGIAVTRTVANQGRGVRRLAELLGNPRIPQKTTQFPETIEKALSQLRSGLARLSGTASRLFASRPAPQSLPPHTQSTLRP